MASIIGGVRDSTPVQSDLRDKFDYAGAVHDHQRAAQAGGPRQIARDYGRPRGSDRFPPRRLGRAKRKR
jgi:hypothetical protein